MKRLLLVFIPLVFFLGCEKEDPSTAISEDPTIGYNCSPVSGACVEGVDGFYLNLEDCQSECWCVDGDFDNDGICDGEYDDDYCLDCVATILEVQSASFDWDDDYCGSDIDLPFSMYANPTVSVCTDYSYDYYNAEIFFFNADITTGWFFCEYYGLYWEGTITYFYDCP